VEISIDRTLADELDLHELSKKAAGTRRKSWKVKSRNVALSVPGWFVFSHPRVTNWNDLLQDVVRPDPRHLRPGPLPVGSGSLKLKQRGLKVNQGS
jgi:hypothetical protein